MKSSYVLHEVPVFVGSCLREAETQGKHRNRSCSNWRIATHWDCAAIKAHLRAVLFYPVLKLRLVEA